MLQSDDCILRNSRAELDEYLLDLGVQSPDDLRGLDVEFIEQLRQRIIPAKRKIFFALFEVYCDS